MVLISAHPTPGPLRPGSLPLDRVRLPHRTFISSPALLYRVHVSSCLPWPSLCLPPCLSHALALSRLLARSRSSNGLEPTSLIPASLPDLCWSVTLTIGTTSPLDVCLGLPQRIHDLPLARHSLLHRPSLLPRPSLTAYTVCSQQLAFPYHLAASQHLSLTGLLPR